MSPLNPKAKRLIEPLTCISSEGKRNLIGLLSLMTEILHPVNNDETAPEYKPKKRASRHALKKAQQEQAVSGVGIKDVLVISLLLIGYILGNTFAPTEWTERGTQDPALTGPIIWINE